MQTFNAILNDILIDQSIAKHFLPSSGIDGYKVKILLGYQDVNSDTIAWYNHTYEVFMT